MQTKQDYYENINIVRGMAIFLVVLGHALANIYTTNGLWTSYAAHFLFILIYSFHMPLFIFLSGFCNYRILSLDTAESRCNMIKKRFERLMVPYVVWGILYIFLDIIGGNYTWQEFSISRYIIDLIKGDNANWQLWTLYTLFVCVILSIVFFNFFRLSLKTMTTLTGIVFFVFAILNEINGLPSFLFITIISSILLYFFFFCLGMMIREKKLLENWEPVSKISFIIGLIALFFNSIIGLFMNNTIGLGTEWTKIIGSLLGINLMITIATFLQGQKFKHLWNLFGNHCMDIYILANICQVIIRKLVWKVEFLQRYRIIGLLLSVLCGIVIPILIYNHVLSKWKITRKLLFGND